MRVRLLFATACCFTSISLVALNGQVAVNTVGAQGEPAAQLQQLSAKLKVRAALVDKDLNVKPIPKLRLALREISNASPELTFATNFDGMAEVATAPGNYELTSQQPTEFQGRRYSWKINITLPPEGSKVDLSIDNAQASDVVAQPARKTDELTALFQQLQPSVVTVWSEFGHGTGFIVDPKGLLLTNQHVIGPSEYIAVQFNDNYKIPATLLASDAQQDIAVLWVNLAGAGDVVIAPIPHIGSAEATVVEGERVFTIGSPLSQRKILTTGVVSKVEKRAIISDININPGNSGGPLFNSLGFVVGLTTFGESARSGPGISGIVRIEEALSLIDDARKKMGAAAPLPNTTLPVEPDGVFPIEAIKQSLQQEKFKTDPYIFGVGDYEVGVITPILKYHLQEGTRVAAAREKEKRSRKHEEAVQGTFRPLDDLKSWAEYAGEYKAVLTIRAQPKLRETLGSAFARGLTKGATPAKLRFKADFYKMVLKCGNTEVQPIHPGKIAHVIGVRNLFINATDATYEGLYTYPFDAISSSCGTVTLELYSEKNPNSAKTKTLDSKTINRIVEDFLPYAAAGR